MNLRTSTPRSRRPFRQQLGRIVGAAALIVGVSIAGLAGAQPANAAVWDFCKSDQTFAAPLAAGDTLANAPKAETTKVGQNSLSWVPQVATPGEAYQGGGMTWFTFGTSCADFAVSGTTMISNFLFQVLADFPARVLGLVVLLVFRFGTLIGDVIIGDGTPSHLGLIGPVISAMHQNFFLEWAPLMIAVAMIGALWNVARRRTQKGIGDLGWLMAVIVGMGILASPSGTVLLRTVNDATEQVTVCAVFAMSGACSEDASMTSLKDLSNAMVETLDAPIWASGALGSLAGHPFATEDWTPITSITFQAHPGVPNVHSENVSDGALSVPIPLQAIPSSGSTRTFGDVWRWTQTYTSAEMAAIRDHPGLACQDPNSPDVTALSKGSNGSSLSDKQGQLCAYKWLVRAAVISYIVQNYPGAYGDMAGQGTMRLSAGMSGLGVTPLAWGIAIIGFMTLFYMLELIFLFLISPLVGLMSLRDPAAAKKWGGRIGAALVKRVAAGLVLGLILWMVGALEAGILNLMTDDNGLTFLPPWTFPFITAIICLLSMIVGFVLFGRIRDMILGGMHLPEGDAVESGLKKALGAGVAAASGAVAAGSGLRMLGAGQALMRSGAIGGTAVRESFQVGDRAGRHVLSAQARLAAEDKRSAAQRQAEAAAAAAAQRTPPVMPGGGTVPPAQAGVRPGPGPEAGQDAAAAWETLLQTRAARQRRAEELRPARERRDTAAASMQRVQAELARFEAARDELLRRRTADALAAGDDPELAAKHAEYGVQSQADQLAASLVRARQELGDAQVHLDVAERTPPDWSVAADAHLRHGSSFEQAQAALHLDATDAYAWQRAQAQMRRPPAAGGPQS